MLGIKLSEIATFLAVAEAGSINGAARRLNLTQPAVTRQVQRLEAELGLVLLDRRSKPPVLTAAGRDAIEQCRRILDAVDDLKALGSGDSGTAGRLRLGFAHGVVDLAVTRPIDDLRTAFPMVALQIGSGWTGELIDQVRDGALDAAVVLIDQDDQPPQDLQAVRVGTEPVWIVAAAHATPAGLILNDTGGDAAHPLPVEALMKASWVLNPEGCGYHMVIQRHLERMGGRLKVAAEVLGPDIQLSLIARGVGLGLVPGRRVAQSAAASDLRQLNVEGLNLSLAVWVLRSSLSSRLSPAIDHLAASLAILWSEPAGNAGADTVADADA
ncbi:transcriptional regulator [Tistrella bauzanensis]|uniref:Transcriptional regulator n=1 Tax=Tistrella bauzanensis TaxID=657419 RepID=A0ABQ1IAC4_9PROT|nr:LysR family transcriptional regulator [Tistrella bauzanensis]GGB24543.1 transcriptional regulator [Tistrella bauzanensis]